MQALTRAALLLGVGLAGALAGGAVVLVAVGNGGAGERGQLVRLGTNLGYADGAWCSAFHHFCILEPEPGEALTAFYTYTTHPLFREQGCEVRWIPETEQTQALADTLAGSDRGGFREPCGGATFDRGGRWVFGPAARDLDRFPVEVQEDAIVVDTRRLVCGRPAAPRGSAECDRAPRVD